MKISRTRSRGMVMVVLALLVASLVLAACGRGGLEGKTAPATGAAAPTATAAPVVSSALTGDVEAGKAIFNQTCFACHGEGGVGVPGLGKNMPDSEFIKGLNDDDLVAFLKVGRDAGNPANTTGVAMPPRGGNPALNDQGLYDVVAFIRTLTGQAQ